MKTVWNKKMPKVTPRQEDQIRKIISKIILHQEFLTCPDWYCDYCDNLFPRLIKERGCPCQSSYTKRHLINVLNKVLRDNNLKPVSLTKGKE